MADTKASALTPFTPALTDLLYAVDDPAGTPASGTVTPADLLALAGITMSNGTQGVAGPSLSGSQAFGAVSITQTWNTTGAPTALKLNVTDTASDATSNLLDLQIGGASKLSVSKAGTLNGPASGTFAIKAAPANNLALQAGASAGVYITGNTVLTNGHLTGSNANFHLYAPSGAHIGWGSSSSTAGTNDTSLTRAAAAIVGVRNGSTGGGALSLVEMTAPGSPAANGVYLYAEDDGSGLTRAVLKFSDGSTVILGTQAA